MLNQLKAMIQYLLPKQLLTLFFGWLANKNLSFFTTWIIKGFIKLYRVDMSEAEKTSPEDYATFNDFFARKLGEDARPIEQDNHVIVMPADGVISQFGVVQNNQLLQAKGHIYTLDSLVACHPQMIDAFRHGYYVTTYLAPSNYHRIHMPCSGQLREMIYVPGSLFSVNKATTENISNIFARNERVICLFDTEFGPMVQVLVGATIVGSIEVDWEGCVTPPREGLIKRWTYPDGILLEKGQDMGCFKLGSTVITLFSPNSIKFFDEIKTGTIARVGHKLAEKI